MGANLGKAYVQIIPSAQGIKNSITDSLSGEASKAGQSAGSLFTGKMIGAMGALGLSAGIGSFIKNAVNEGGELEQNLGGTEAVFGDFAKNVQSTASEAYKNMGLSASDYMATANKMGSLFQGSGVKQEKALKLTTEAMQRAADVASVMGLDTSSAMESIAGAAKANFTMMDNLGVAMNATTIEAYALEKGINFDWKTADNAQKAEVAMKMFMERTQQYAGNFANEASETFSGSLGALTASWKSFLGSLAVDGGSEESVMALITSVANFGAQLIKKVATVAQGVVKRLPDFVGAMARTMASKLPDFLNTFKDVFSNLMSGATTFLSDSLKGLGNFITSQLPQLVITLVAGIGEVYAGILDFIKAQGPIVANQIMSFLVDLLKKLPSVINSIVVGLMPVLSSIIDQIVEFMPVMADIGMDLLISLIKNLPEIALNILEGIQDLLSNILIFIIDNAPKLAIIGVKFFVALIARLPEAILEIVKAVPSIVTGIVDAIAHGIEKMAEIGVRLVEGLWEGIKGCAGWLWDKLSGWATGILDDVASVFGIHSPSRKFAWFGEMMMEGMGKGIEDNISLVDTAMDGLVDATNSEFKTSVAMDVATSNKALSRSISAGLALNSQKVGANYTIEIKDAVINDQRDIRTLAKELASEVARFEYAT